MADGQSGSSWWGGWIETAKQKSVSAVEFLKKDLQEFTNVMHEDTTKVADDVKSKLTQENASAATQKVKEGVSKVLGGLSKALAVENEGKLVPSSKRNPGEPIFDRAQARLKAIQLDPGTYCDEPDGPKEDFEQWTKTFNAEAKKGDISELLVANADVRSIYTQLVPSEVSHTVFWQRYFYKTYKLEQDEARKTALKKRADNVQEQLEMQWDDDDWDDLEEPGSPPKESSENIEAAMKSKKDLQDKQDKESINEGHPVTNERVPQNGSSIPDTEQTSHKPDETSVSGTRVREQPEEDTADKHSTSQHQPETSDHNQVILNTAIDKNTVQNDIIHTTVSRLENTCLNEPSLNDVMDKNILQPLTVDTNIKTRDKGDMVVVGSEKTTPSSDSTNNKGESTSLSDDWEKDFDDEDLEVTEEDLRLAEEATKKLAESGAISEDLEDDWESWE